MSTLRIVKVTWRVHWVGVLNVGERAVYMGIDAPYLLSAACIYMSDTSLQAL